MISKIRLLKEKCGHREKPSMMPPLFAVLGCDNIASTTWPKQTRFIADVWDMYQGRDQCQNLGPTREHNTTTHVKSRKLDIGNYKIEDFVALDIFYISCIVKMEIKLSEIRISVPTQRE
jgi:hypothetical protein